MGGKRGGESRGPNGIERRAAQRPTERIARILTQLPAHAQKARKEREPASQPASVLLNESWPTADLYL